MIPAPFEYRRVSSLDEAAALLGQDDEAKALAGGMSLIPLLRLRMARPSTLVDIGPLRGELAYVRREEEIVAIGSLTRHHDVATSAVLREDVPLLAHVASLIGDPQVRHRGTIGGALAHADPAGDVTTVLRTLEAPLVVHGRDGRREIGVDELAVSFLETSLRPGELIAEVRIPVPPRKHGWAYTKFRRRAQDWATVAVAAIIERRDGEISRAAVGLVNMGPIPLRAAGVEAALAGADPGSIPRAAELAADGTSPVSDLSADADFRRHLARVLTRRTVQEAFDRAAG